MAKEIPPSSLETHANLLEIMETPVDQHFTVANPGGPHANVGTPPGNTANPGGPHANIGTPPGNTANPQTMLVNHGTPFRTVANPVGALGNQLVSMTNFEEAAKNPSDQTNAVEIAPQDPSTRVFNQFHDDTFPSNYEPEPVFGNFGEALGAANRALYGETLTGQTGNHFLNVFLSAYFIRCIHSWLTEYNFIF